MSLRISNIEISEFRGISHKLIIDFSAKGSNIPVSLLLAGDNGVGKSSIVDAFEFVLQGRINGKQALSNEYSPLSMSRTFSPNSYVSIEFSDGSKITRKIVEQEGGKTVKECVYKDHASKYHDIINEHPDFAISPFTLRRADILRFWHTKDRQRQSVFFDYLRKNSVGSSTQKPNISAVRQVLKRASSHITEVFLKISPSQSFISNIEILQKTKKSGALSFRVQLRNKEIAHPRRVFSEANLDLLALIIFLEFMKESAQMGQAKFFILDDVLQSVDASIRVLVTEYILDEFSDWQLIFTVHDRLWLEQLRTLFLRKNMRFFEGEIIKWDFMSGPLLNIESKKLGAALSNALTKGDTLAICAQSGLLLERISNTLSYSLPIAVTRRKGDKYTLGDLWPGILKSLSKTKCKNHVEAVNHWLHLRNLAGAHFNEWAQSLSLHEAQEFGSSVLDLLDSVHCDSCFTWIERTSKLGKDKSSWSCRCGKKVIEHLNS